jgi:hypothetical protein
VHPPIEGRAPSELIDRLAVFGYTSGLGIGALRRRVTGQRMRNGPIVNAIMLEAVVQCVRLGHTKVEQLHLLLAVLSLEEQVRTSARPVVLDLLPRNDCFEIFARYGISYSRIAYVAGLTDPGDAPSHGRRVRGDHPADWYPEWSDLPYAIVAYAHELARGLGHAGVGADHVAFGILNRADSATRKMFEYCGVLLTDVETEIMDRLEP